MVILYKSNTGLTKQYAEMLASELGVKCYPIEDRKSFINEEIVYLGWIMAGTIQGFSKLKKYNIKAVCGVGMANKDEGSIGELKTKYTDYANKIFYAQGGFDITKLKGIYKFMMNTVIRNMDKMTNNPTKPLSENDKKMFDMVKHGENKVSKENIQDLIKYLNNYY